MKARFQFLTQARKISTEQFLLPKLEACALAKAVPINYTLGQMGILNFAMMSLLLIQLCQKTIPAIL